MDAIALLRFWREILIVGLAATATYFHVNRDHAIADCKARWDARDKAEWEAAYQVQQAHQQALEAAEKRNHDIEAKLNDTAQERDAIARDRDTARRLLGAAIAAAGSGQVPKAADQSAADGTPGARGDGSLAQDVGLAIGECRRNAERLGALQAELAPQL